MSGHIDKNSSGDSMGRFDAVLTAYKSRPGDNSEPPSELDARILALAALPARVHLSTEAPMNTASRNRPRRAPRWLSWAAGAGALLLSGGVLRIMLQDSPNATRMQENAKEITSETNARQADAANTLPDPAPISGPIDAPELLELDALDQRAAQRRADLPIADAVPAAPMPSAEIAAESTALSAPASKATSPPEIKSIQTEPLLEPAKPVGRIAQAMPNARAASPAEDGVIELNRPVQTAAPAEDKQAPAAVADVAAAPAPQAFPESSRTASEDTLDAVVQTNEPMAKAKEFETKSDDKPYAAKLAQPIEESFAAVDAGIAADKAAALSESDDESLDSVVVSGSRISRSEIEIAAPAVAIPEATETMKKAPTAEELGRAFAKLRKLERAGDLEALRRAIENFRAEFPASTKIPKDLRAVFEANPAPVK